MAKSKRNTEREHRIQMEIIVDAYGPEEQALAIDMIEAAWFMAALTWKCSVAYASIHHCDGA